MFGLTAGTQVVHMSVHNVKVQRFISLQFLLSWFKHSKWVRVDLTVEILTKTFFIITFTIWPWINGMAFKVNSFYCRRTDTSTY